MIYYILAMIADLNRATAEATLRFGMKSAEAMGRHLNIEYEAFLKDGAKAGGSFIIDHQRIRRPSSDFEIDKSDLILQDSILATVNDKGAGASMYTLQKAKEEIDAVAKHATDIAAHALVIKDQTDAKLEAFKKEISELITTKFGELEKAILGDAPSEGSTAIADLSTKVGLLIHGSEDQART